MSEDKTTETAESTETEGTQLPDDGLMKHLEGLESMKSFKDMAERRGDKSGETEEPSESEEVEEPEEEPEPDAESAADTAAPFLTLSDGTGLTKEEAIAGYMRHKDYTQKNMERSAKEKEYEPYLDLVDAIKSDHKLFKLVSDYVSNELDAAEKQETSIKELRVPENYKGDQFVEATVETLNTMRKELADIKGGVGNMQQRITTEQKQAEIKKVYNERYSKSYSELEGQLGVKLNPEDFVKRIQQYFEGKGLSPGQRDAMIIGPDAEYLRANVFEAYRDDLAKMKQDKVSTEREKRQPKGASKRALKATGKPPQPVSTGLPKLPDGRLDRKKAFVLNPVFEKEGEG